MPANNGTSTNSIYVRFGDKEGLFSAIVEPVLNEMVERFFKIQERFHQMSPDEQAAQMPEYSDGELSEAAAEFSQKYPTVDIQITIGSHAHYFALQPR